VRFIAVPAEDAGLQPSSAALEADIATTASEKMKGAMSNFSRLARSREQWARFRFSVIGPLLAAPPNRGELQQQLKSLAAKKWDHPITGQRVQFGLSTIERWFYTARNEKKDPVQALRRKIRSDQGRHPSLTPKFRELLINQYRQHPNWSYQLHADNLAVLIEKEPTLGATPCYGSIVRFMKVQGLIKRVRRGPVHSPGAQATEPMLEGVADLTLARLNEATLAWIEMEYNRSVHSELGESPLQRYLHHRDVSRPCPSSAELKIAFTAEADRTQRRSDGTFSLKGIRFEIPSRYHHFQRLNVRVAFWDLSHVHLVDPKTGAILCRLFPLDKNKNAQGGRAAKGSPMDKPAATASPAPSSMAPLLQKLIQQYATTGLPPAYLPQAAIQS
jgi:hypothetical protein